MGLLPIILVTLGIIFLWGIVNYYSLSQFRESVHSTAQSLREQLQALGQAAQQNTAPAWQTLAQQLQTNQTQVSEQAWQTVKTLAADNNQAQSVVQARKKYEAALKAYNEAVRSKPSAYVAMVFGFKKIA